MINIFFIFFLVSFTIFFFIAKISYKLNLLDVPISKKRSIHDKPTAYTGGVALCIILTVSIFIFNFDQKINSILSIAFMTGLIGFLDDKFNLSVGGKLSLQLLPIVFLIIIENLSLLTLGDYNNFELKLNSFSIPFTILAVLFLINSFNYFDGIDGVLGSLNISILGILFFLISDENLRILFIIIIIPILLFLLFNFSFFKLPKLFLGDSGSLMLGFLISFILIFASNEKLVHPILLAFSISIFVYEFLAINFIRLKKEEIFKAGQDHLHHILFKNTKSKFYTILIMLLINIIIFTLGYVSFKLMSPFVSILLFTIFFFIYLFLRVKYLK